MIGLKYKSNFNLRSKMMLTGFGMGLGGGLVMVLFWGVLISGAVWLARGLFPEWSTIASVPTSTRRERR